MITSLYRCHIKKGRRSGETEEKLQKEKGRCKDWFSENIHTMGNGNVLG
jgi:hypothetical protein